MKWIKNRTRFLNEAKLRDVLLKRQAKEVTDKWGERYLDYEEVTPTDNITQGKWKLSEEDKMKALSSFFDCDMKYIMESFAQLPDKLNSILGESIKLELLNDSEKQVMDDFNIKSPTIDQIVFMFENVFRKLSLSETNSTEVMQRDETGRPIRDEEGNMLKIQKKMGDPIFTNNLVNINTFIQDYKRCYQEDDFDTSLFSSRNISQLRNLAKDNQNPDYKYEYKIFGRDLYLQIDHNPSDILNMSISKFFGSCQHLYTGGYRQQLLSNVFDPNSIPAILVFDTPIMWGSEKISDKLPLSRMMLRNIETQDGEKKIFFDRAYPDRMKDVFGDLVTKYSKNEQTIDPNDNLPNYLFAPDVEFDDELDTPYMDRLRLTKGKFIGVNTTKLYLSSVHDWSAIKISPQAKLKEVVIETTDVPENFFEIKLDLDWVKFKMLNIKSLENFEKIKTDSIAFDKCKFNTSIIDQIYNFNPGVKKLQLISCDLSGDLSFSKFSDLEELHLIYTLDNPEDLILAVSNLKLKSLIISGDLTNSKEVKSLIGRLKSGGCKVEIKGPQI